MTDGRLRYSDVGEGRVAKHDVERPARSRIEVADDVRDHDLRPRAEIGRGEIAPERLHGFGAPLDERGARGATRKRLDPKGAGPREEIEDPRSVELRLDDREEGFPDPIRRGPRTAAARHHERAPLRLTGDDSHQASA